jgi:hypothetical protein
MTEINFLEASSNEHWPHRGNEMQHSLSHIHNKGNVHLTSVRNVTSTSVLSPALMSTTLK